MIDVKQIVATYLSANGFDGLQSKDGKCGCLVDDLFCSTYCSSGRIRWPYCLPGYLQPYKHYGKCSVHKTNHCGSGKRHHVVAAQIAEDKERLEE